MAVQWRHFETSFSFCPASAASSSSVIMVPALWSWLQYVLVLLWVLQTLEDPELLRRRGRWANKKMMDIYVQEITAVVYLKRIPQDSKDVVLKIVSAFPAVVDKVETFLRACIPTIQDPGAFYSKCKRDACQRLEVVGISDWREGPKPSIHSSSCDCTSMWDVKHGRHHQAVERADQMEGEKQVPNDLYIYVCICIYI